MATHQGNEVNFYQPINCRCTMTPIAHPHAALMALYAQDAAETYAPWERWEAKPPGYREWMPVRHIAWHPNCEYRRKPQTIRIGEFDVPEPLRKAPIHGTAVYAAAPECMAMAAATLWHESSEPWCTTCLQRGLLHLTREAAELHARALISLTEQK